MGQEVAHFAQHALVTLQPRQPAKHLRHDQHRKVPGTVGRAGVTDVVGAVVVDLEHRRCERLEATAQGVARRARWSTFVLCTPVFALGAARRAQDASSARWRDSHRPWASAKTRNSPIPPQTLKLTQVSVE